jgi:hypothetical protein
MRWDRTTSWLTGGTPGLPAQLCSAQLSCLFLIATNCVITYSLGDLLTDSLKHRLVLMRAMGIKQCVCVITKVCSLL